MHSKERRCPGVKLRANLFLLVDPAESVELVVLDLLGGEPEGNLLLGVLDAVGAVADVAADIDGEVTTDGAGGGGKGVGGTEDGCYMLVIEHTTNRWATYCGRS
jgi:hypothetical protein